MGAYSKESLSGTYKVHYPGTEEIQKNNYRKEESLQESGPLGLLPLLMVLDLKVIGEVSFTVHMKLKCILLKEKSL